MQFNDRTVSLRVIAGVKIVARLPPLRHRMNWDWSQFGGHVTGNEQTYRDRSLELNSVVAHVKMSIAKSKHDGRVNAHIR